MDLTTDINQSVAAALAEDIGSGDLTANLIPEEQTAQAYVISRETAVLCGSAWFDACFHQLDAEIKITWLVRDGTLVKPNQTLCEIEGKARPMLTAERTALNFLQTLSATATVAKRYADAIKGTKAVVMDTRKTLPSLRRAQKYAVKTGGGENQRIGLFDGILIKENHIMAAGGVAKAMAAAKKIADHNISIQIEVETLEQLEQALKAGAKLILLDNFDLAKMREAVKVNQGRAQLEASGNVSLETIRAIAETGVDRISVGSLTKDIKAVDLSMRFHPLI
jgi:nicotinate-nucleotide pyrophosphorylase (carboxylating)